MKCNYKNCFCDDENLIVYGKKKYHECCHKTMEDIKEITKMFTENINRNVVYSQLISVINNIIFVKGNTSAYLKFALQYYIDHKITLNYPLGLHYVVQNKDVNSAWEKTQATQIKQKMKENVDDGMALLDSEFTYKVKKQKTIGDIFDE